MFNRKGEHLRKVFVIQEFDVDIEPRNELFEDAINEFFESVKCSIAK